MSEEFNPIGSRNTAGWQSVESSNIDAIAFDREPEAQLVELWVRFKTGASYSYVGVPLSTAEDFLAAQSKGKFFAENIKGKYPFQRM
jgi:hypothetical protein